MPQPTASSVMVDALLTNISVAYIQQAEDFIAAKVFPQVPVDKQTGKYATYTKNDWFRDEAQRRGPSTESAGSGYNTSNASYACDVFALHKDISDMIRANAQTPFNMDRDATAFITQRILLKQEIQFAADAFAASIWGTDSTPGNLWSDFTASDPISDIAVGKRTILGNTGMLPNTMVLGYQVWEKIQNHPDFIDRLATTNDKVLTEEIFARLIGVKRVLVAKAVKATNVEGETAAYSFVHGKHALLCYVEPSPSLLMPSAGYTFVWQGVSQGMGQNIGIKSIPMPWLESTRVEGQVAFDNKIVATDLGYFFNGAVS